MTRIVLVFLSDKELEFLEEERRRKRVFSESDIIQNLICTKGIEKGEMPLVYKKPYPTGKKGKIVPIHLHEKTYEILKSLSAKTELSEDMVILKFLLEYMEKRKREELSPKRKKATWDEEEFKNV